MEPGAELSTAIDGAYKAFEGYVRPRQMDAAPTRDQKRIQALLTSGPLRGIASEHIGPYSGWAMTTVGSGEDYKHFLPRILEEAVRNQVWMGTAPDIIASRLEMAGWRVWPSSERSAVIDVFRAAAAQEATVNVEEWETKPREWRDALTLITSEGG